MLYPLKFKEIFVEKIWGGQKLAKSLHKKLPFENTGESWELSGVPNNVSVVSEGTLVGNNLEELSEIYMDELLGDEIWNKHGNKFPLLIKYIDANDFLSVQVHPNDQLAYERYQTNGKNEMWYIVDAEPDAELILGFNCEMDKNSFLEKAKNKNLTPYLNRIKVKKGDAFFIPAGLVHAIGKGVLIAEIQQSSDVTYRIDDYGRTDSMGNTRELHIEKAVDALNFEAGIPKLLSCRPNTDSFAPLFSSEYFSVNLGNLQKHCELNLSLRKSFTILMCLEGKAKLYSEPYETHITKGATVLLPAIFNYAELTTDENTKILEIFI